MRWFKHVTNSHNDEKLVVILDEFGPEGYGVWWLLIETIAKEMDKSDKCSLTYPMSKWAKSLCCSKKKAAGFLKRFAEIPENSEKKLIFLKYSSEDFLGKLEVSVPNILKYRDEYSKKSGQPPDKKPTDSGAKIEIEIEIEKKQKTSASKDGKADAVILDFFEALWQAYPADGRVKKKEAMRHYLATVKTDADMDKIDLALGNYLDHLKDNDWKKPQNGSTWFNNWQDWTPEAEDGE